MLPIRAADAERRGLLAQIVDVNLVGLTEAAARRQLNAVVTAALTRRAKSVVGPGSETSHHP